MAAYFLNLRNLGIKWSQFIMPNWIMLCKKDTDERNIILFPSVDKFNFDIVLKASWSKGMPNS